MKAFSSFKKNVISLIVLTSLMTNFGCKISRSSSSINPSSSPISSVLPDSSSLGDSSLEISSSNNSSPISSAPDSSLPDSSSPADETRDLEIIFFDVGQGDGMLITLPNNQRILIDSGNGTTSGSTAGQKILTYLNNNSITHINYAILTHNDSDHIGGFPVIVNGGITFDKIYFGPSGTVTQIYTLVSNKIDAVCTGKVDCRNQFTATSTNIITLASDSTFSVQLVGPVVSSSDRNELSLITRISYHQRSFLFAGDCETNCEGKLVSSFPTFINVDLLKINHHGSSSSTTSNFLATTSPNYAVIQSGIPNSYGHPTATVINRLSTAGITLFRNDNNGMIIIRTKGTTLDFNLERGCNNNFIPSFTSASGEGSANAAYYTYNRDHC